MKQKRPSKKQSEIHELYRKTLKRPNLTYEEIEEMRQYVIELARTICEHVWKKDFY